VLNPNEPPWYVTRMPGGVRGAEPQGSPYLDQILGSLSTVQVCNITYSNAVQMFFAFAWRPLWLNGSATEW
jgi:hypothetical protein